MGGATAGTSDGDLVIVRQDDPGEKDCLVILKIGHMVIIPGYGQDQLWSCGQNQCHLFNEFSCCCY